MVADACRMADLQRGGIHEADPSAVSHCQYDIEPGYMLMFNRFIVPIKWAILFWAVVVGCVIIGVIVMWIQSPITGPTAPTVPYDSTTVPYDTTVVPTIPSQP
jgi:hypothetical protein